MKMIAEKVNGMEQFMMQSANNQKRLALVNQGGSQ
jgi:hypothetical protein